MDLQEAWDRLGEGLNNLTEAINKGLLKVFGNSNERLLRRLRPKVDAIGALEPKMQALSDEGLKALTPAFRARLAKGETLEDILVEAFAAAREAGKRFLKMRHFDVQLLGGMVLHSGRIAEMVTGEGKTLVATLPAYLNALAGKGVHVVTVNDYLARRDAEWMSPLYNALGLTVGAIQSDMDSAERQHHYGCDITYGTNNEFGFDYLRDNMKPTRDLQCQRELFFALIDEVDSVLIDEARTPLIISGPAIDDPMKYAKANRIAMQLKHELHFEVKEKEHTCHLTDQGVLEAERLVGVESFYTAGNMEWPHLLDNALKAHHLYRRDKEYMVRAGEVIIIDEHTGRAMEGRQWSDGLHQAVEAKEGVRIKEETQTLATITFQNFFKLYKKLGGMTGTAMTEANEFYKIYKLDVVAIPTNKPLIRENSPDVIFCTEKEKWKAIIDEVKLVHKTRRPILIGTTSVEKSEMLSEMFKRNGIAHEMLNAKNVEREAEIVAQAGRLDAVTISTNMAGRGTDIVLGGNPEIMAWAQLKSQYSSRLDIPPDIWRDTVGPFEGPMKIEGREVAAPRATAELAKLTKTKRPAELAAIVDGATRRQLMEPQRLVDQHGLVGEDKDAVVELVRLHNAAHPGGLHIVGTERHESRRIDNQLRGRSGRQGDPGSSRFFLSLDDDLMRIFAGDWVKSILQRLGMQEGEAIESRMVSRRIEAAQKKVEERNFEIRKNLLEYDEIMDTQRKRVYSYRQNILNGDDCKALIVDMIDRQIDRATKNFLARDYGPSAFAGWISNRLGVELNAKDFLRLEHDQAIQFGRAEALRQAQAMLNDAMDEHLNEEVDAREWSWEALTSWINSRWDLDLKSYDLKRIGRDKLGDELSEQIRKAIDKINLDGGDIFFDARFGAMNLVGWANQKFALGISLEELPTKNDEPAALAAFLKDQAHAAYARKEVEFPVYCGLARFFAEKTTAQGERYDRDGLLSWAASRFETEIDRESFRNLPRQETIHRLLEISDKFYRQGKWLDEVKSELEKIAPRSAALLDKTAQAKVAEWVANRLQQTMNFEDRNYDRAEVEREVIEAAERKYRPELHEAERSLVLQFLDTGWKDHLYAMDHAKSGIGLVGYAQIDPKVQYKREGKQLFEEMWDALANRVTDLIFRMEEADTGFTAALWNITNAVHESAGPAIATADAAGGIRGQQDAAIEMSKGDKKVEPIRNRGERVGRNDPCPCGSGRKYKNCCMGKNRIGNVAAL